MKSKIENGTLTIYLEGRIDSTCAPQLEKDIAEELKQHSYDSLVMNAKELEYISSAGLRVMLKLRQSEKSFKIINANQEVYEIFDMTGFTEIMDISRAYHKMSVDGCEIIGKGAKGTVYRYDPETVVKVYNNPDSLADIQNERKLARTAFVLGVPTAISYDIVRVDGMFGSVFELLDAKSYTQLFRDDSANTDKYVKDLADLLNTIHGTIVKPEDMPDYKLTSAKWLSVDKDFLPTETFEKLSAMVDAVPDTHTMIHGDYHSNNVMFLNNEPIIIDMDTLSNGHPIFELANVYTAYVGFGETMPEMTEDFLGLPYETAKSIWYKLLPEYLGTINKDEIETVNDKTRLLAYVRILRHIVRRGDHKTEKGAAQIKYYIDNIIELTSKLDRLDF